MTNFKHTSIVILIHAIFIFVSIIYIGFKSSLIVDIQIHNDMYIDDPKLTMFRATPKKALPQYCSNKQMNFYVSESFNFTNIDCIAPSNSQRFIKTLGGDSYFITTMIQKTKLKNCNNAADQFSSYNSDSSKICSVAPVSKPTHQFVLGVDDTYLTSKMTTSIPALNVYNDRSTLPIHLIMANGTTYKIYKSSNQNIKMNVHEWLRIFGNMDDGLNTVVEDVVTETSIGKPRNRIVGGKLQIDVVLKSTNNNIFRFPSYNHKDVIIEWHLTSSASQWTRTPMNNERDATSGNEIEVIGHGLLITWNVQAQLYSFYFIGMLESIVIVLVVFISSRSVQLLSMIRGGRRSDGSDGGKVEVQKSVWNRVTPTDSENVKETETEQEINLRKMKDIKKKRMEMTRAAAQTENEHPEGSLYA